MAVVRTVWIWYFKGRNFRGQKVSRDWKIAKFRDFNFRDFEFLNKNYRKNFREFFKIFISKNNNFRERQVKVKNLILNLKIFLSLM